MRVKLGATIPTVQYGNIMPEFEVEAESIEAGLALIEPQLRSTWNKYVESGKELAGGDKGVLLEGFVGGSIWYNDATHTYTNDQGEVYLSSSQYAASFAKPFDKQKIAGAMAKKADVNASDVLALWELKGKISRDLGTALHNAVELKRHYKRLCESLGKETNIHLSPMVKEAVESLEKLLPIGNEVIEAVVIDHANKRVGRVDLINVTGEKQCEIIDYKTGEMKPDKLAQYKKQLEFTKAIMELEGWNVTKLRILGWNGSWKEEK